MATLDVEHLRRWVDRTQQQSDDVTQRTVDSLRATLEFPDLPRADALPVTLHWCLAPEIEPLSRLDEDGHPFKGEFLPPVPLARRLWAGADLAFHDGLRIGDRVQRVSRVADVQVKTGRSGTLCFITLVHEFATARGLAVEERHHLVYRDVTASTAAAAPTPVEPAAQWEHRVPIDSKRLFRYSALTFNAHRIHYDIEYCQAEGYSGLLVHGPLQASLLAELAASVGGARAFASMSFRAVRPLVQPVTVIAKARESAAGLDLWMCGPTGATTMTGKASLTGATV
jgi:3-methylfumaryl-CoA hydratase